MELRLKLTTLLSRLARDEALGSRWLGELDMCECVDPYDRSDTTLLRQLADWEFVMGVSVAKLRLEFLCGSLGGSMILGGRDAASETVESSRVLKDGGTGKARSVGMPESLEAVRRRSRRTFMLGSAGVFLGMPPGTSITPVSR